MHPVLHDSESDTENWVLTPFPFCAKLAAPESSRILLGDLFAETVVEDSDFFSSKESGYIVHSHGR